MVSATTPWYEYSALTPTRLLASGHNIMIKEGNLNEEPPVKQQTNPLHFILVVLPDVL